jgi:site-specific DNA-methyltransferase (adenine-specific)
MSRYQNRREEAKGLFMRVSLRPKRNKKLNRAGPWLLAAYAGYEILNVDIFEWLKQAKRNSIHAVVTNPPYGLIEYTPRELKKMQDGRGGVWRIPPSFDGCQRKPLPRFTVLSDENKNELRSFFQKFADLLFPVVVPGAHVFIATNPLVSHLVYDLLDKKKWTLRASLCVRVCKTRKRNATH